MVAADRDDAEALRRLHDLQRELGLDAEWLGRARRAARARPVAAHRAAGSTPRSDARSTRARCRRPGRGPARAGGARRAPRWSPRARRPGDRGPHRRRARAGGHRGAGRGRLERGAARRRRPARAPGQGPAAGAARARRVRRRRRARACARRAATSSARRRPRDPRRDRRGAGLRHHRDRRGVFRLLEAAREVLPDIGELELVGPGRGCGPARPTTSRSSARRESTASSGPPATAATACCWRPSPASWWPALLAGEPLPDWPPRSPGALRGAGAHDRRSCSTASAASCRPRATVADAVRAAGAPGAAAAWPWRWTARSCRAAAGRHRLRERPGSRCCRRCRED